MAWLEDKFEGITITQGVVVDGVSWGDEKPSPLGIILSNPCDIDWDKASYILIASLISAKEVIQISKDFKNKVGEEHNLSKKKTETIQKLLEEYIHNVHITRYFFMGTDKISDLELPHLFIDFQRLITIPISKKNNLEIIAHLPSPHREKMIMHFSSYISRIGVDRVDEERLNNISKNLAEPYQFAEK